MFKWYETADILLEHGERFCLVTISEVEGSTPRDTGTVMLVTKGMQYGTIGGGNLEHAAVQAAMNLLQSPAAQSQTLDYILGPDVEQCCGGRVKLHFKKTNKRADLPKANLVKELPLYLFGAGHVGLALATALTPLPFDVLCYDTRPEKINGNVLAYSEPEFTILSAPKNTIFLVMTHDHNLDYELVNAVFKRDDFAFLGLIGSKTKRARFLSRLRKDGFTDAQLARLTCPIGLDGIQGKEPEIIAASVAAQLLQLRTGNGD